MRKSILALIMLTFVCVASVFSQEKTDSWGSEGTPVVVEDARSDLPQLKPMKLRRGVSAKDRRAAGVTIRNVSIKLRELQAEGALEYMDNAEASAEVLWRIQNDNPAAFKAVAEKSGDFQSFLSALIAFLEKILPFLLMFA